MALSIPGVKSAAAILEPAQLRTARRGRKLRSVGWFGVLTSVAILAVAGLGSWSGSKVFGLVGVILGLSVAMINWTRIWVRESREPFRFTFSVAEFDPGPDARSSFGSNRESSPLAWLRRDLTEQLSARVGRLSLLDESEVKNDGSEDELACHVHISGWYGLRRYEAGGWCLEVAPRVRLGARGAPERMARTIRFALGDLESVSDQAIPALAPPGDAESSPRPSRLPRDEYERLFERVYWSVASEVYMQIRHGVEAKVALLPPGRLRAAAYLYEADDYAASNTIDAYDAARRLYRKAHEMYDLDARPAPATRWRQDVNEARKWLGGHWGWGRRQLATAMRRFGRREILTARAQLGYGRMVVAAWHLKRLGGGVPAGLYKAQPDILGAIKRLERLPRDIPERDETLFRAQVTLAICNHDLENLPGAKEALRAAEETRPAVARRDGEFLLAAGLIEQELVPSLRLLASAVERERTLVRAQFEHAMRHERTLRRRDVFEPSVANAVDAEYAAVLAVDPGNVSAWANRGYVAWLMSEADPEHEEESAGAPPSWRRRTGSALKAGREYKDVRGETMVAELDWNLARFAAEEGRFADAYSHYLQAVSAMIAKPGLGFVGYFGRDANATLVTRFDRYEAQVRKLADAAMGSDPGMERLIRSVRSFALNDCGMAHHAYARQSPKGAELARARELFRLAIDRNDKFVLPKYNLATLCLEQARRTDLNPEVRKGNAEEALRRSREIIEVEPEWALARFLVFDVELSRRNLAAALFPGGELEVEPDLERWLRPLFPHRQFRGDGQAGGKIDASGDHLSSLLADEEIEWRSDFDEIQIEAMLRWARALLPQFPAKALMLCEKVREELGIGWGEIAEIEKEAT